MKWNKAPDIGDRVRLLASDLGFTHVICDHIYCFRSTGSSGRAIARIWPLPKIWQQALSVPPSYSIEVISEKFDRLSYSEQQKTLIHELMHIPKTFSGSLLPHRHRRYPTFRHYRQEVERLFRCLSEK